MTNDVVECFVRRVGHLEKVISREVVRIVELTLVIGVDARDGDDVPLAVLAAVLPELGDNTASGLPASGSNE